MFLCRGPLFLAASSARTCLLRIEESVEVSVRSECPAVDKRTTIAANVKQQVGMGLTRHAPRKEAVR